MFDYTDPASRNFLGIGTSETRAQTSSLRFKQDRDGAPVTILAPSEIAVLEDPLFNLVLKDRADLRKLSDIQAAIQPDTTHRLLFVVDERIVSRAQAGSRRMVHAFTGTHAGEELDGNLMLSAIFGPAGLPAVVSLEGWGWDNHRQRYNYYKLDSDGAPPGEMIWKFRASSERAELLSAAAAGAVKARM